MKPGPSRIAVSAAAEAVDASAAEAVAGLVAGAPAVVVAGLVAADAANRAGKNLKRKKPGIRSRAS